MTTYLTQEIKSLCGANSVRVYPWNLVIREPGVSPILTVRLTNTIGSVREDRADALSRDDRLLKSALDAVKTEAPDGNYLVILTSSGSSESVIHDFVIIQDYEQLTMSL